MVIHIGNLQSYFRQRFLKSLKNSAQVQKNRLELSLPERMKLDLATYLKEDLAREICVRASERLEKVKLTVVLNLTLDKLVRKARSLRSHIISPVPRVFRKSLFLERSVIFTATVRRVLILIRCSR